MTQAAVKLDTSTVPTSIRILEEIEPSNVRCIGARVLLKVMGVEMMTHGGLFKPESAIERELFAKCRATLVSKGAIAFSEYEAAGDVPPEVGEEVMIAKYAGITVRDKDYNLYRFANDIDVVSTYSIGGKN